MEEKGEEMKIEVKIVKLHSGKYVKNWQYSQEHFDVIETDSPFEAEDFTGHEKNSYETFFKDKGELLVGTFTWGEDKPTYEVAAGVEMDDKRFYLPGVTVKANCPKCNKEHAFDLGEDPYSLSYPKIGEETEVYAECDDCDTELSVKVKLHVGIEVAT